MGAHCSAATRLDSKNASKPNGAVGPLSSSLTRAARSAASLALARSFMLFCGDDVFAGEVVGCEGVRRADVLDGKTRVVLQDLLLAVAGGEVAEDEFDRDAYAVDDGLAHHALGVRGDSGG